MKVKLLFRKDGSIVANGVTIPSSPPVTQAQVQTNQRTLGLSTHGWVNNVVVSPATPATEAPGSHRAWWGLPGEEAIYPGPVMPTKDAADSGALIVAASYRRT